jgi:hypothetical protein
MSWIKTQKMQLKSSGLREVTSFAERQRLVGKPAFDLMEARYVGEPTR